MRKIKLTQNKYALIDDEDFDIVSQYNWYTFPKNNTYYAARTIRKRSGRRTTLFMHRFLLGLTDHKIEVDHVDHNGLNNQKLNLRPVTKSQNYMNQSKRKNCSSIYKGVHFCKQRSKWVAAIKYNSRKMNLGGFDSEIDAAKRYDEEARKYFGKFASLNFPIIEKGENSC